jgi:hypothetical protein
MVDIEHDLPDSFLMKNALEAGIPDGAIPF